MGKIWPMKIMTLPMFSEMCAVIINVLVRSGRALYIMFSRVHSSLVYIFLVFFDVALVYFHS